MGGGLSFQPRQSVDTARLGACTPNQTFPEAYRHRTASQRGKNHGNAAHRPYNRPAPKAFATSILILHTTMAFQAFINIRSMSIIAAIRGD